MNFMHKIFSYQLMRLFKNVSQLIVSYKEISEHLSWDSSSYSLIVDFYLKTSFLYMKSIRHFAFASIREINNNWRNYRYPKTTNRWNNSRVTYAERYSIKWKLFQRQIRIKRLNVSSLDEKTPKWLGLFAFCRYGTFRNGMVHEFFRQILSN